MTQKADPQTALASLLDGYSAEVTRPDRKTLDAAANLMPKGARVYIASLPKDTSDIQVTVAKQLRDIGLEPVPHIVARNFASEAILDERLKQLTEEAGVKRMLVLGGDRDEPEGPFDSSLQLIETGLFQKHGVTRISLGAYPEGHPRIPDDVLTQALDDKLAASERYGFEVVLVTQLCFEAGAVLGFVRTLRQRGITCDLRVGVAGPASRKTLLKYAMICGVGPSLRALKERHSLTKGLISNESPQALLSEIAMARSAEPNLGIWGVHFFTFAALKGTIDWAESVLQGGAFSSRRDAWAGGKGVGPDRNGAEAPIL